MRDAKTTTSKFTYLIALGVIFFSASMGVGQQTENAGEQAPLIIESPKSRGKARVVAIRRVNLLLRDPGPEGITDDDRKPYVEIELYVGHPNLGLQLSHLVQIGDREFGVNSFSRSGEDRYAVLLLEVKDFEDLTDGAEIVYRVGEPIERERFKQLYDEGKIAQMQGVKVGRLDKKMIDLEPTVEKSSRWKPPQ